MECQKVDIYFSGMYNIYMMMNIYMLYGSESLEKYKIRSCGNADFCDADIELLLFVYEL